MKIKNYIKKRFKQLKIKKYIIKKKLNIINLKKYIYQFLYSKDNILNSPGYKAFLFPINYINFFKHKIIPFRQISAYDSLKKFQFVCKRLNVDLYAAHWTLLGVIRASGFAGRPKDIDFYVSTSDMDIIFDNLDILASKSIKICRCKLYKGVIHFQPKSGVIISLTTYKLNLLNNLYEREISYFIQKKIIIEKNSTLSKIFDMKTFDSTQIEDYDNSFLFSKLKLEKKEKKIFNDLIYVPSNYLELLKLQYGINWKFPTGKQFD